MSFYLSISPETSNYSMLEATDLFVLRPSADCQPHDYLYRVPVLEGLGIQLRTGENMPF